MFRVISEKTGVPEGYRNPPGKYWALVGLEGRERAVARRWRAPSQGSPNWTRGGGVAPLSLSLSLSFLPPSPFLVGLGKDESYSY